MKRCLVLMLVLLATTAYAGVREDLIISVKNVQEYYELVYQNGRKDYFMFKYTAKVKSYMRQDGESSSWKHPLDTRRCSYRVSGFVEREGFFITGAGEFVPFKPFSRNYTAKFSGSSGTDVLDYVVGGHKTCGHYLDSFRKNKKYAKDAAIGLLTQIRDSEKNGLESRNDAKRTIKNVKELNVVSKEDIF
ncbi:hypothetical protein [Halodesulfovibrio sp.]|uniref:hypothetical protein n=1 Tax=Halodesulfovibrio sp. TaxID=1912772 RepID=UPI0025BCE0E9|nr:hypothetical protein [Halodesulfovibrio sp.]